MRDNRNLYTAALTPDPREGKLPVWAQNLLGDQRRTMELMRRELDQALDELDPAGSVAVIHPYGEQLLGTKPIGLGDVEVRFRLGAVVDEASERYIDVRRHGAMPEWLYLRGGERLQLEMDVSNSLRVRTVPGRG